MEHYHIEVLTPNGFSVSTQSWQNREDAVKQIRDITPGQFRTVWLVSHSHDYRLHQHRTHSNYNKTV